MQPSAIAAATTLVIKVGSSATPSPVRAEIARTSVPGATLSAAARRPARSTATSVLFSTTTGVVPPAYATAR